MTSAPATSATPLAPVIEIVLTGGPCAGKSSFVAYAEQKLSDRDFRVFTALELATVLIMGGAKDIGEFVQAKDERFWAFQRRLLLMQGDLRKHFRAFAEDFYRATGKRAVVIYDRAEMDIMAYVGKENFERIMREEGVTYTDARDSYDGVIHLVTAAQGAEEFYTLENNAARTETPEMARDLDGKTLNAWVGHQNLNIIDNSTDFAAKMDRALDAVLTTAGLPTLAGQHKFKLLDQMPSEKQLRAAGAVRVEIEQTYLLHGDPHKEMRLRKRTQDGETTYYRTIRDSALGTTGEAPLSRRIDERTYEEMLALADPAREPIRKTRWCFAHGSQHMELDHFHTGADLAMLEVKTLDMDAPIDLPEWLGPTLNVSADSAYRTGEIARQGLAL